MKKTSKTTQPLPAAPVIPTAQVPEAPHEPQDLPAPVPPQTVAIPPTEGPQMQDVVAEEEQASPAQDELSDSPVPREWEESENPHPPEKRARMSSPDYNLAEERSKTYEC